MGENVDRLLGAVVLLNFVVLGSSRMRAAIRATALQGLILAVLPLLLHGRISFHLLLVALITMAIKGLAIPLLLLRAIRDVTIRREIEPLVGLTTSLLLGALATGLALLFADSLPLAPEHAGSRLVPAALATVFAGFLVLTTRKKAVTQVVGYMILENGIFLFGMLLIEAMPLLVELGVLLDVIVGVFVMGIIVHRIQRTFSGIDTTYLSSLRE